MSVSTADLAPLVLDLGPALAGMTDHALFEFCRRNPDWRIERTANDELILMPPIGGESGLRNNDLSFEITKWAKADGTGLVFDSSTGFRLSGRVMRSPDVAWIRRERWDALSAAERAEFPPICPDFVAEIRSSSDRLASLHAKMEEYLANGARLGWLIDPIERIVHVYRPGRRPEALHDPSHVPGGDVLPGLSLEMRLIWG